MKYDIKEKNHPDWINKYPWYNTSICYKLHGTVFDDFIINDRTDRYNIMCFITAHDKLQPKYTGDVSSGGGRSIPQNARTAALESLGATLHFIDCWLKLFHKNNQVRSKMYNEAIKSFINKYQL